LSLTAKPDIYNKCHFIIPKITKIRLLSLISVLYLGYM
jgi:hypothetical protein